VQLSTPLSPTGSWRSDSGLYASRIQPEANLQRKKECDGIPLSGRVWMDRKRAARISCHCHRFCVMASRYWVHMQARSKCLHIGGYDPPSSSSDWLPPSSPILFTADPSRDQTEANSCLSDARSEWPQPVAIGSRCCTKARDAPVRAFHVSGPSQPLGENPVTGKSVRCGWLSTTTFPLVGRGLAEAAHRCRHRLSETLSRAARHTLGLTYGGLVSLWLFADGGLTLTRRFVQSLGGVDGLR
jgi:hypothetical protein